MAELMVANPGGVLKPGAFAQVGFDIPDAAASDQRRLTLLSSAILFQDKGTEVALVGPDSHVHLRHISVGRDLGGTTEIASGLSLADRVVNNPPDSIAEGQLVRVVGSPDSPAA